MSKPKIFTVFTVLSTIFAVGALVLICLEMKEYNLFEVLKARFF